MKTFALRLLVTSIVLYALGAVAYGLLHYPPGERPDVGGVLGDFTSDLGSLFRRKKAEPVVHPGAGSPAREAPAGDLPAGSARASLDDLKGDSHLSLALAQIQIPDSGRLSVAAARVWDTVRPIHAKTLPEGIEELGRLRRLRSTDKESFQRDREAARARLVTARETLLPFTQEQPPFDAAVELLDVLDRLDAELAKL